MSDADRAVVMMLQDNAAMMDKCERLQAENAKLREQLESIVSRSFRTADKMACLEAENDSLRELVRDMAAEIRGLGVDFARVGWCDYANRMRELGVEV